LLYFPLCNVDLILFYCSADGSMMNLQTVFIKTIILIVRLEFQTFFGVKNCTWLSCVTLILNLRP
jgi:hypothetical protein